MDQKELRDLEEKCIQECAPACTAACPVHVDVRGMMQEISRGDFTAALKLYKKSVPFPNIICHICDQPCQDVCKREEVGDSINIRALERACVEFGDLSAEKSRPLPKRSGHVAIIGGGISGLTAAYDLARKGYTVAILEAEHQLGGSLWKIDRDYLPAHFIRADIDAMLNMGIEVWLDAPVYGELSELCGEYDAVYVATGPDTDHHFELERDEYGTIKADLVTFGTNIEGIFAGGGLLWGAEMHSSITSISEGRRAAISIDRYLQKVSLTASRTNEGRYPSCLYTNTQGIEPRPMIEMGDWERYDRQEAIEEAQRCLQCECMECVKVCEYLKHFERYPRRYVREIYNNLSIVKGTRYANSFINSCSLCGLCAEVCPEHLDMGAVNLDARRTMVEQKRMPASAHDFALRDMQFNNSDHFRLARNAPGAATSDDVFFPGCQLSASSPDVIEKVYGYLSEHLPDRSVGLMLGCCGAPANWAGRDDLFQNSLSNWRYDLWQMGNPRLVLACSSCYQVFKTHLPDVEIVSLWELFDQHGLPAEAVPVSRTVAIHDPCSTRHESAIHDSVRHLATQLGCQINELALSRERTECCSYGGHMWLANPDLARKTVQRRAAESPDDYVTYCAMCRDFFAGQGKRTWHILDLIYGMNVDEDADRPGPGQSLRHENRARLKRHMLKNIWGEEMDDAQSYESINLYIAADVAARLDQRLILIEDIQRVIEHAERTGRKLVNPESGHYLASYKPTAVTYWVEYLPQDDGFTIFNAYSHRMEVPGSSQP